MLGIIGSVVSPDPPCVHAGTNHPFCQAVEIQWRQPHMISTQQVSNLHIQSQCRTTCQIFGIYVLWEETMSIETTHQTRTLNVEFYSKLKECQVSVRSLCATLGRPDSRCHSVSAAQQEFTALSTTSSLAKDRLDLSVANKASYSKDQAVVSLPALACCRR